jgi:rfaE bifunctional protein nucleotidyltransferase chain/domain
MKRILTCGCFDPLHIGHVAHLTAAKTLGDHLTVALTADDFVGKGPGRPVFTWREREQMLSALRCVDAVTLHVEIGNTLRTIKPDVYVKGIEYKDTLFEEGLCHDLGIEVVFLDTHPVYSSTKILNGELLRERASNPRRL